MLTVNTERTWTWMEEVAEIREAYREGVYEKARLAWLKERSVYKQYLWMEGIALGVGAGMKVLICGIEGIVGYQKRYIYLYCAFVRYILYCTVSCINNYSGNLYMYIYIDIYVYSFHLKRRDETRRDVNQVEIPRDSISCDHCSHISLVNLT